MTEAYVYDPADLGDSTSANPDLTFRAGSLVKRWLFGPQVDEPLAETAALEQLFRAGRRSSVS